MVKLNLIVEGKKRQNAADKNTSGHNLLQNKKNSSQQMFSSVDCSLLFIFKDDLKL